MNKQEFGRFNKMYNYLANLEAKKFTMKSFVDGKVDELGVRKPFCQTKGCWSGYLPVVFPKDWEFVEQIVPLLKKDTTQMYSKDIASYFGLDEQEVLQLTVAKNYRKANLESVLRRMKLLAKTYGCVLRIERS
jgi:hypothetical protein